MSYSIKEFERIYSHSFPAALRLAMSMLHDESEAADAVQDAFVKLWEVKSEVEKPESYIIRTVRNICLNRIEASDTRERIIKGYTLENAEAGSYTADNETSEKSDQVERAVKSLLTEREQQVVDGIFSKGLKYNEVSDQLNVSVSLVNKCVVNALKTLRNHFKSKKL